MLYCKKFPGLSISISGPNSRAARKRIDSGADGGRQGRGALSGLAERQFSFCTYSACYAILICYGFNIRLSCSDRRGAGRMRPAPLQRHLNETAWGAGRILPAPAYEIGTDL
ncbi:uncharacterized protein Dmul_34290 [Desulfococcus multivorans]|nr:uncharacterized protein Dmul_34290 [Desulfococcus multivorans]